MNTIDRAREVLQVEIEALRSVRDQIGDSFTDAVERIEAALADGGKVVVSGVGKNLHIAEKISATLASTGTNSVVLHPTQAMHGDLGILRRGDILLALSYSGASDEILIMLPVIRRLGIPVVTMTGDPRSPLAEQSAAILSVAVAREACPFGMAPTASTTATLALGDALAMVLLDRRGFRREDYALLHPGGAIGRALLLKVADIMRTGERMAVVPDTATIRDAIVEMTRARAGSTAVVDGDGRLAGIFTDGDLRRHLPTRPDLLTAGVAELMTRSPITVAADRLAAEVLNIFTLHNIDDLPVTDGDGRLVGAVDIQDLPKLKIL